MGILIKENKANMSDALKRNLSIEDKICSSYIDFRIPHHVDIDGLYYASLLVINYSREMESVFLDKLMSLDIDINVSIHYEKANTYDVIKELTYTIGNVGADIKTSNENQQDIDIVGNTYTDAKYIRKQLQLGEEELFYIVMQMGVYGKNEEELSKNLSRVESIAISCGLTTIRANFRQEPALKSSMPYMSIDKDIESITKRNVLTSGLVSTYPFVSNELFDKEGILIGTNTFDKSIIMLDRFCTKKYKNANMFVVGTSGSGKSYFVKLMINRNRLLGISQYVIDPDREYKKICQSLNGTYINIGTDHTINVFDIREEFPEDGESLLINKVSKLKVFFSMIFERMEEEEKAIFEHKLFECYYKYGITEDNESLYVANNKSKLIKNKVFRKSNMMPRIEDLYDLLKKDKKLKKYAVTLKTFVTGTLKYLNSYTNVDTNNKLIVVDIHDVGEENLPLIMYIITDYFWDLIKLNRSKKKILYLDEVWKLINKNEYTASFVFKLFKTIRKYGGGATAITQDISDFFMLDDGKYGKGVVNNSSIKCMFQLEETDLNALEKVINISEEEKIKLVNMKRGTSIIHADKNVLMVDVVASKKEHELVTTDRDDLERIIKEEQNEKDNNSSRKRNLE